MLLELQAQAQTGGSKGAMPPQIFRKDGHFVLWEAFFQTK